ncbi:MAG: exodeoxyribonuclease VII small subunit [Tissierellaceae bacterium]|nr:exodeoxyribonuclease VII small subunit [Tissierellaceae bacterium]
MDLTYEDAIIKLEKILDELEKDDCTLEESLEMFKKGVELYNYCNDLITKVEGEVKILLEDDKGDLVDSPYPMEG